MSKRQNFQEERVHQKKNQKNVKLSQIKMKCFPDEDDEEIKIDLKRISDELLHKPEVSDKILTSFLLHVSQSLLPLSSGNHAHSMTWKDRIKNPKISQSTITKQGRSRASGKTSIFLISNWEEEHKPKKLGSGSLININNLMFLESDQRIRTIGDGSFNVGNLKRTLERILEMENTLPDDTKIIKPVSINLTSSEESDDGNSSLVKDENDNSDKDDDEDIPDKIAKHVLTVS
ncbi:hypothetical protein RhiirA4_420670 [Rhizophagus irregularis]|uniref:Uncharacterized protein n=1 Tax=Rhizophagus irregularis TaxID=588596 RepID=A0A2I1GIL3_9GLOM|nr:hypothetical protein RhiirA4_420670 [Rhizophagus irregularis]